MTAKAGAIPHVDLAEAFPSKQKTNVADTMKMIIDIDKTFGNEEFMKKLQSTIYDVLSGYQMAVDDDGDDWNGGTYIYEAAAAAVIKKVTDTLFPSKNNPA